MVEPARRHGPFDARYPARQKIAASVWELRPDRDGPESLPFSGFLARFFPTRRRHDFEALAASRSVLRRRRPAIDPERAASRSRRRLPRGSCDLPPPPDTGRRTVPCLRACSTIFRPLADASSHDSAALPLRAASEQLLLTGLLRPHERSSDAPRQLSLGTLIGTACFVGESCVRGSSGCGHLCSSRLGLYRVRFQLVV